MPGAPVGVSCLRVLSYDWNGAVAVTLLTAAIPFSIIAVVVVSTS